MRGRWIPAQLDVEEIRVIRRLVRGSLVLVYLHCTPLMNCILHNTVDLSVGEDIVDRLVRKLQILFHWDSVFDLE